MLALHTVDLSSILAPINLTRSGPWMQRQGVSSKHRHMCSPPQTKPTKDMKNVNPHKLANAHSNENKPSICQLMNRQRKCGIIPTMWQTHKPYVKVKYQGSWEKELRSHGYMPYILKDSSLVSATTWPPLLPKHNIIRVVLVASSLLSTEALKVIGRPTPLPRKK